MEDIFSYRREESFNAKEGLLKDWKITVQPNISVAGWPADAGSKALADFTALEDATIIDRLKNAGADICGATKMSEFGFGIKGSKAGEALRKKEVNAELVLDLMGEARLAAMRANVFGFKPGYGIISRFGLIGLIPSMEACGILSSEVSLIGEILKIIAGADGKDFCLPDESLLPAVEIIPGKTKVGVIREAVQGLSEKENEFFTSQLGKIKEAGWKIKELTFSEYDLCQSVHNIIGAVEASSCAGRYDSVRYGKRAPGTKNWNEMYLQSRGAFFGLLIKSYLFQGAYFQFEKYSDYESACRIRKHLVREIEKLTAQTDFLITPVRMPKNASTPLSLTETYDQFAATLFANVAGLPALCMPAGENVCGIQICGARLCDLSLLSLGEYLCNQGWGK